MYVKIALVAFFQIEQQKDQAHCKVFEAEVTH